MLSVFWGATFLNVQVIVIMYVLIFAAVLRLRYTQPATERAYRIPGGKPGVWLASGGAIAACAFAFVTGFFPPGDFVSWDTSQRVSYYAVLVAGFLVLTAPPFVVRLVRCDGWPRMEAEPALESE